MEAIVIVLIVAAVIAVLLAVLGYVCFHVAIVRQKNPGQVKPDDTIRIERNKIRDKNKAYLFSKNPEDLTLKTPEGFALRAWFVPSERQSKRFVICIHGYNCNGPDEFSHTFDFYHNTLGYSYLLPDLRSHGRSEGKYIGFGAIDRKDIRLWIDYLIERFGEDIEIILHGISMGAATAMLTCCDNPPSQVKLTIEDCGFTNAYDQMCSTLRGIFLDNKLSDFIVKLGDPYCKLLAGYHFKESDPLGQLKNAATPIMFVHGSEDTFVPTSMVYELYEACPTKKRLFVVEGAIHAFSYYNAMPEYQRNILEFIDETIGAEETTEAV